MRFKISNSKIVGFLFSTLFVTIIALAILVIFVPWQDAKPAVLFVIVDAAVITILIYIRNYQLDTYEQRLTSRDKEFIINTAHQFNTPLSIIKGCLSLLKEKDKDSNQIAEALEANERLISLTKNLASVLEVKDSSDQSTKNSKEVKELVEESK